MVDLIMNSRAMRHRETGKQPQPEDLDENFLNTERLFCIKGNKIFIAEPWTRSHTAWFRNEGWIPAEDGGRDEERFFARIINGVYAPNRNTIYLFREADLMPLETLAAEPEFEFETPHAEPGIIDALLPHLPELKRRLHLPDDVEIFAGSRNISFIFEPKYIGTLKQLFRKANRKELKNEEMIQ
ncbi:MAG: hypothetical protein KGJ13_03315 [Patescibacteria group bacterium]|nr:hypothetical protein [Patescibacteria group bacterium]